MDYNEASKNLHLCNCHDKKQTVAYDWHEHNCAYRAGYIAQQERREDAEAKRAKAIGAWR